MIFLKTVYTALDQCPEKPLEDDIAVFEKINRILTAANTYIGYKIRNDGVLYLMHNRLTGAMPGTAAMDRVICEKIASRLQCTVKARPVLETLSAFCTENGYICSARVLTQMISRCNETGLSDYWDCL